MAGTEPFTTSRTTYLLERKAMARFFPLLTGLVVLVGAGFVHGLWTGRWKLSAEPEASVAKLNDVAMHLGDWEGRAGRALGSEDLGVGEIAGYLNRIYSNPQGQVVSALIVCGRPGPISQHTPDVCYGGEGFELVGAPKRHTLRLSSRDTPIEFMVGHFHKEQAGVPIDVRIFWSWSATGSWTAPDSPRWTFGRYPALFKLYLVHEMTRDDARVEDDPALELAKVLIPELRTALFAGS